MLCVVTTPVCANNIQFFTEESLLEAHEISGAVFKHERTAVVHHTVGWGEFTISPVAETLQGGHW